MWRLIAKADVLVENFRPGAMVRLGFGFDAVHAQYLALVYCSISSFGQTGPYRERGGFDLVAQAMSRVLSVTSSPEQPAKVGVPISDLNADSIHAIDFPVKYSSTPGQIYRPAPVLGQHTLAILIVEQNTRETLRHAQWAYVLVLGQNCLEGSGADLLQNDVVINLYLGRLT